jgi:hypothetical protein
MRFALYAIVDMAAMSAILAEVIDRNAAFQSHPGLQVDQVL